MKSLFVNFKVISLFFAASSISTLNTIVELFSIESNYMVYAWKSKIERTKSEVDNDESMRGDINLTRISYPLSVYFYSKVKVFVEKVTFSQVSLVALNEYPFTQRSQILLSEQEIQFSMKHRHEYYE